MLRRRCPHDYSSVSGCLIHYQLNVLALNVLWGLAVVVFQNTEENYGSVSFNFLLLTRHNKPEPRAFLSRLRSDLCSRKAPVSSSNTTATRLVGMLQHS